MTLIRRDLTPPPAWPAPREHAAVLATIRYVRERDPVGHQVHTVLALLYLFTLPLSTAPSSITFALLLGYTLLRLPNTWWCYTAFLRMGVLWALLAWTVWSALSVAWSPVPAQGWDEVRAARVVLTPFMLWPVLDRVPWLIGAALAGVLVQNLVQIGEGLRLFGMRPGAEGRLDGLIHAIHVGAWCVAAMAWHLSAMLHGRGALRWASTVGLAVAAFGLVASGSRGPWISAAIALPLGLVVVAVRRPDTRRFALVLAGVGVLAAAVCWPVARRVVVPRVESAMSEVTRARTEGVYWTSAGLRIGMWSWAWTVFRDAPIAGAGAGSYQAEIDRIPEYATLRERHRDDAFISDYITRDHPHSTYLYTLSRTGVVGGVLLLVLIALLIRRCLADPPDHPYADGTLFVLVSWLVGAQFECYELSGHTFGLLALLVAVTLAPRPPVRCRIEATDEDASGPP